jgi:hypothetical protein
MENQGKTQKQIQDTTEFLVISISAIIFVLFLIHILNLFV